VLRADSGKATLDLLGRLQRRNETVALLLVDPRMPQMNGVEMLQEAIKLYPDAKRTLLTAYADTDAAIKAINDVHLHHYLLKPWDPPEAQLFPVLDDLLNDWYAGFHPPFEGIRVLGTRWSPQSYDVRNFLARNQVPYQWLDADAAGRDQEVGRVMKSVALDGAQHIRIVVDCQYDRFLHKLMQDRTAVSRSVRRSSRLEQGSLRSPQQPHRLYLG